MSTSPFTAIPLTSRVTRIDDAGGVLLYLLEGDDRAILVDSGFGVGDLPSFVRGLTSLPLTVVLTHGHVDHAFGAGWFDEAYLHPDDLPVLADHRILSAEVTGAAEAAGQTIAPPVRVERLRPLADGDTFDLGGLGIEVVAFPGHTPGSVALVLEEERMLLTGDAANQFTFLFHPEASPLADFAAAIDRVRERTEGRYDRILVSHGSGEVASTLFDDLQVLIRRIQGGEDDRIPFEFNGVHGLVARRAEGEGPADDAPNIVYDPRRAGLGAATRTGVA